MYDLQKGRNRKKGAKMYQIAKRAQCTNCKKGAIPENVTNCKKGAMY